MRQAIALILVISYVFIDDYALRRQGSSAVHCSLTLSKRHNRSAQLSFRGVERRECISDDTNAICFASICIVDQKLAGQGKFYIK